ncbi:MAG TPA: SH3 domain-containing protein [Thermomicrobiales bacterium]|jgi:murein DD-endopeptidase MepM/ murein hydrolase activator NlpD
MLSSVWRVARGPVVFLVGFLLVFSSSLMTVSVRAATDLEVGGQAVIAHADGDPVRLREAPGLDAGILTLFPEGTVLDVLGGPKEADGGSPWYRVSNGDETGYMIADYLFSTGGSGDTTTTTDLNLRAGPSTSDDVLDVMPEGAVVEITGDPENGFYPVRYGGVNGWAFGDNLDFGGSADVGGSDIVWPVSGGEWEISQGYNGSSHQNESSTWQYEYSFDIARTDGNTAGQPVYSPVDGSVRWTEQASGGISIDMGNGYAVAIFHITVDPSLSWGDPLSQGQYIGYISGPGEDGNVGFDHLHLALWATDDGGNWSREAVPFVGQNAIAGVEYPDVGGYSQWSGTVFYP